MAAAAHQDVDAVGLDAPEGLAVVGAQVAPMAALFEPAGDDIGFLCFGVEEYLEPVAVMGVEKGQEEIGRGVRVKIIRNVAHADFRTRFAGRARRLRELPAIGDVGRKKRVGADAGVEMHVVEVEGHGADGSNRTLGHQRKAPA